MSESPPTPAPTLVVTPELKTPLNRTYRPLKGYAYESMSDESLQQYRTGIAPANPAGAQALCRRGDQLEDQLAECQKELAAARESLKQFGAL